MAVCGYTVRVPAVIFGITSCWLSCDGAAFRVRGEKGETLVSSAKQAWGYRQARGRWCGHGGGHTHTHTYAHAFMHTHIHTHKNLYRGDEQGLCQSYTVGMSVILCCVCVSVCVFFGPGSLYLSCLIVGPHADVPQKGFPVSKDTEWHHVRLWWMWSTHAGWANKERLTGTLTFTPGSCTVIKKNKKSLSPEGTGRGRSPKLTSSESYRKLFYLITKKLI